LGAAPGGGTNKRGGFHDSALRCDKLVGAGGLSNNHSPGKQRPFLVTYAVSPPAALKVNDLALGLSYKLLH
jgi:hypothetical protein